MQWLTSQGNLKGIGKLYDQALPVIHEAHDRYWTQFASYAASRVLDDVMFAGSRRLRRRTLLQTLLTRLSWTGLFRTSIRLPSTRYPIIHCAPDEYFLCTGFIALSFMVMFDPCSPVAGGRAHSEGCDRGSRGGPQPRIRRVPASPVF